MQNTIYLALEMAEKIIHGSLHKNMQCLDILYNNHDMTNRDLNPVSACH